MTPMPQPAKMVAAHRNRAKEVLEAGIRAHRGGDPARAERLYREAVGADAELAEAHNNLGALLASLGREAEAEEHFERAVALRPRWGEALNNLGFLRTRLGSLDDAVRTLERAVEADPRNADGWNNLGNAHLAACEYERALQSYDRALAVSPRFRFALSNRAVVLRALGRYEEAIAALKAALEADGRFVDAMNNLGLVYRDLGDRDKALECHLRASEIDPDHLDARVNVGVVLQELRRYEEAECVALALMAEHPARPDPHDILGLCAYEQGRFDEAFAHFSAAAALDPEDVNAQWNLALIHLHRGDYRAGFAAYDWRKRLHSHARDRRPIASPHWQGEPLARRTILLLAEQGAGDTIQFIRYAAELKRAGAGSVHLECDPALASLMISVADLDRVIVRGAPRPPHDVHAFLLSVPGLLGTDLESVPAPKRYLSGYPSAAGERIEWQPDAMNVGIVWAGAAGHARDHIRSTRLHMFAPLLDVPGVRFHSLQKGDAAAQLAEVGDARLNDLAPALSDFTDTAAVLEKLDLVITVDTSVAHLAGALGRPVWLLLPKVPDWRWLLDREDTPWYPRTRLFRQTRFDDWSDVFERVAERLREVVAGGPQALMGAHARAGSAGAEDHGTGGRDLREALAELLRPGDLLLDAASGPGAAPTLPPGSVPAEVRIVACNAPALAEALAAGSAEAPGIRRFIRLADPAPVLRNGARPPLCADPSLSGIVWSEARPDAAMVAARGLSAHGYDHYRIARDDRGVLLDPWVPGQVAAPVVSLRRSFVEALSGAAATAAPSAPSLPSGAAASDAPRAAPRAESAAAKPGTRAIEWIGIDWPIGSGTGWEVFGANLAAQLAIRGGPRPRLAAVPAVDRLTVLARHALSDAIDALRLPADERGLLALRALGNRLTGADTGRWPEAARNVGFVFFEDTHFDDEALARGHALDRIVAGSTWNAEVLRAHGLDHVEVALQGVDPTLFHPAPRADLFPGRFVVFSGGKLEYRKGQDIVVAAFREFRARHPEALLVFAWFNPWPHIMEEITFGGHVESVPRLNVAGRIDFGAWLRAHGLPDGSFLDVGAVPNAQMPQILREADVGIFPNRCEGGTNLVAMECMACGVPTILSANSGHLDLIRDGNCYPLRVQRPVHPSVHCTGTEGWGESSVEEIVAHLEAIHANRAEAAARGAAGARTLTEFSWSDRVAHLLAVLDDLLA